MVWRALSTSGGVLEGVVNLALAHHAQRRRGRMLHDRLALTGEAVDHLRATTTTRPPDLMWSGAVSAGPTTLPGPTRFIAEHRDYAPTRSGRARRTGPAVELDRPAGPKLHWSRLKR